MARARSRELAAAGKKRLNTEVKIKNYQWLARVAEDAGSIARALDLILGRDRERHLRGELADA